MRRSLVVPFAVLAGALVLACADQEDNPQPSKALTTPDLNVAADTETVAASQAGQPLPGLNGRQTQLFNRGMQVFATVFTPATGLGPLFNSTSCAQCHNDPTLGGYGDSAEIHATAYNAFGFHGHSRSSCDVLDSAGGPVAQQHVTPLLEEALHIQKEPDIPGATAAGIRTTPLIFGLGLLDAVSDETIRDLARIRYPEGVHGHPAILADGRIGRFGRKANGVTLDEFNAGAFFNEMGVTNSLNPIEMTVAGVPLPPNVDPAPDPELDDQSLRATDAFVKFLAPVPPLPPTPQTRLGQRLFDEVRCTSCHIPVLRTGFNPVEALRFKRVKAYTDLLLHDLGDANADICNGAARPSEFRTQPLMGMQFLDMFMHDGLSETIEQAVQRHGGEASASRERFLRLRDKERAALVAFVSSL